MKVIELYKFLDKKIPSSLSCEWDNDGLMCCPDEKKEVRRVLVTLDVTSGAVEKAKSENCDVILSHHPLIFKGIKSITPSECVPAKAIELIRSGIAAMSFHTRLDALAGGVNDVLASKLGLHNTVPFGVGGEAIGRVGTLELPMKPEVFAELVKKALGAPAVLLADAGRDVYTVALLGGEGGDDIDAARAAGADTYVSGRLGYHAMTDAPENKINLIEAGHFYTEFPVCDFLASLVKRADRNIECVPFFSNRIKLI
ncbi:MAG: Nif3-like dinuclear metal center hexameric protein [Clostridia bacterium]|nr:Nif3-like dinuclear metal center hexameric protein [Clostridia bacterium]